MEETMKSLEEMGEVISTDVLVIGGGIAGLCAGIKARETGEDVLVVDKGGVGWAGQVPISGGHIAILPPERADEFFQWTVKDGDYLNNQDWTYAFAQDIYSNIMALDALNFPFFKEKGEVAIYSMQKHFNHVRFNRAKSLVRLKASAAKKGVKTLDKVYMIDLLRRDGRVVGAMGFGLVDGKTYIFHAKAVIIASGSCRYKRTKLFVVNAGEGVAMAYRAGAQLINAEFTNTYGFAFKTIDMYHRIPIYLWFENALGENIMQKYYPEVMIGKESGEEMRDFWQITDAMAKEVEAGRGPIYVDLSKLSTDEKEIAKGDKGG
jgi:succinate dehydrogenase/fumarate reductase flavoprotein subunit